MTTLDIALPRPRTQAFTIVLRNVLVWRKLLGPSLAFSFGEPVIYLLGLGFGLGQFIGEVNGIPYFTFLASGLLAATAMNVASFEGMFSVFTRMTHQQTYDAILATPLQVDDIVAGETLWCATKSVLNTLPILVVATLLGAIHNWTALAAIPIFFLVGLCFAGPAIVVAAFAPSYDFFTYYTTLLITPMFIFSGVFYPVATLPVIAQVIVNILPLSHAIALIRPLVAGQALADPLLHVGVLLAYAMVGYLAATIFIRRRLIA
ncbi:MAG: ABC transporter permease [Gammaproteobacteria bacterium]|nr:ABC transporter permease [Gammaproteobacteria bacterium]